MRNVFRHAFALASWLVAAVVMVLALSGCSSPTDPGVWFRMSDPPPEYETWYAEIAECSGLVGSLDDIEWRIVPGGRWYSPVWDREIGGMWEGPNTIYVASDLVLDRVLVGHEMLHHLVGVDGHPQPPFGRCG